MVQPTLTASPRPPALAPLSRTQSIHLEGTYRGRGELDEVHSRLPAFDRVPFATRGGIENGFLNAIPSVRQLGAATRVRQSPIGIGGVAMPEVSRNDRLPTLAEAYIASNSAPIEPSTAPACAFTRRNG